MTATQGLATTTYIYRLLMLLGLLGFSCVAAKQEPSATAGDIERKVNDLVQRMTLEEKLGQLTQYASATPETLKLVREGKVGSLLNVTGAENTNAAQRMAVEQTRLKIPLLFGYDVIHGYRTIFPVPIATASSFDPALIEQIERVAAREASAAGIKWTFAPMVDITRDPRWGRIVEGAGEDPYWASIVAAARVRGFQGKDIASPQSLLACAKHFAAYGAPEGGRDYNTAVMPESILHDVYLPPFHAAVLEGVKTVMTGLHDLNGIPATANSHLLGDILRRGWHFQDLVVSDYDAVHQLIAHGVVDSEQQAAMKALLAGVDMDMADGAYQALRSLPTGSLPMKRVDEAVRRVLRIKFQAGIFQRPYVDPSGERAAELTSENLQLARRAAQDSIVLLKNQAHLLPLNGKAVKVVAVIGPLADDQADQLGSWAAQGRAQDVVTPLEGIKAKLPQGQVIYAKGVAIPSFETNAHPAAGAPAPSTATGLEDVNEAAGPQGIKEAVDAARKAEVTILFLGELAAMTGEASSRAFLDFPGQQEELLEQVVATGKPVVLVIESGRPLDIRWANDHVRAIVEAWYPGVQSGHAIADLIFGDAAPSARLPVSWPRSVGQVPIYYNHNNTGRPNSSDRWHTGYIDESSLALFPFGYGLTFTTFRYTNLKILTPRVAPPATIRVQADVENTGQRPGTEVVQLYVHGRIAPAARPVRELKGFQKITIAVAEKKTVEFSVRTDALCAYDGNLHRTLPSGRYDVWVGPNSAEGIMGTFQIMGVSKSCAAANTP